MKILQVLRGLEYGGVETYVIKLSAGLNALGHQVLVASGDGPLKRELQRAGAVWNDVGTSGLGFLWAEKKLESLIRREGVEIVHAHHGTAGMAAAAAAQSAGVPFVLSVHGSPRIRWGRNRSIQSTKVIVESNASREHLIHQGLRPEQIIRSFIGVDTHRFSPGSPSPALQAELGISAGTPVVLHVSRFSRGKGQVGIALADVALSLTALIPDLVILIAGSGKSQKRVRAAAVKANKLIGRETVQMLGPRTDIPDLMQLATLVVGTATVALEAMAVGIPVVAAGKFGFVGQVSPVTIDMADATCFGDHGALADVSTQTFGETILPLLDNADLRQELGRWGREKVVECYSLDKMVQQIEGIYVDMIKDKAVSLSRN